MSDTQKMEARKKADGIPVFRDTGNFLLNDFSAEELGGLIRAVYKYAKEGEKTAFEDRGMKLMYYILCRDFDEFYGIAEPRRFEGIRGGEDEQEIPAPPQKAPLCLSCKHGKIGAVDDFATCYCPHHGYVGQKMECGEYEAKAGACGKCRQFDKGDNSTFGYCFRNDEIVNEASVKGCFEPKSKAEERPEPLGTVTTH